MFSCRAHLKSNLTTAPCRIRFLTSSTTGLEMGQARKPPPQASDRSMYGGSVEEVRSCASQGAFCPGIFEGETLAHHAACRWRYLRPAAKPSFPHRPTTKRLHLEVSSRTPVPPLQSEALRLFFCAALLLRLLFQDHL